MDEYGKLHQWRVTTSVKSRALSNEGLVYKGYPGREFQVRAALAKAIGPDKAKFFFDKVWN